MPVCTSCGSNNVAHHVCGASSPVAGWYQDPGGGPGRRWWDGTTWTGSTSTPPRPQGSTSTLPRSQGSSAPPGWAWVVLVGGALAVLGSFLPWLTVTTFFGTFSVRGFDGGDAYITLFMGAAVCGVAVIGWPRWNGVGRPIVAMVLAGIAALTALADIADIQERIEFVEQEADVVAELGFGLVLIAGAAILSGIAAIVGITQRQR
jgi:hypothetical protein